MQNVLRGRGPRSDGFPWFNNDAIMMTWLPLAFSWLTQLTTEVSNASWTVGVIRMRSHTGNLPRLSIAINNSPEPPAIPTGSVTGYQKELVFGGRSVVILTGTVTFASPVEVTRIVVGPDGLERETFSTASVLAGVYESVNPAQLATTTTNSAFLWFILTMYS